MMLADLLILQQLGKLYFLRKRGRENRRETHLNNVGIVISGREGNKKSPDFTGLFGLYETALNCHVAERVAITYYL
jgi:hypothetical protein